jgi:hypothetical protein
MILQLSYEEVEIIEEILSQKMIETRNKELLPIIKEIRIQMDEQ